MKRYVFRDLQKFCPGTPWKESPHADRNARDGRETLQGILVDAPERGLVVVL